MPVKGFYDRRSACLSETECAIRSAGEPVVRVVLLASSRNPKHVHRQSPLEDHAIVRSLSTDARYGVEKSCHDGRPVYDLRTVARWRSQGAARSYGEGTDGSVGTCGSDQSARQLASDESRRGFDGTALWRGAAAAERVRRAGLRSQQQAIFPAARWTALSKQLLPRRGSEHWPVDQRQRSTSLCLQHSQAGGRHVAASSFAAPVRGAGPTVSNEAHSSAI